MRDLPTHWNHQNRCFTASIVVVSLIYFSVDWWWSDNENKSISDGTWWKKLTGAIFQINQKVNSKQTRVIHVKAPVNLMWCTIRLISSTTELNLVHLIFIKTRKSGAFLKKYNNKNTANIPIVKRVNKNGANLLKRMKCFLLAYRSQSLSKKCAFLHFNDISPFGFSSHHFWISGRVSL